MNRVMDRQGFTLIEIIVALAILGILAGISVPRFAGLVEQSRIDADQATLEMLNKATPLARLTVPADDPFDDPSQTSDQLLAFLVDTEHLDRDVVPQSSQTSFHWDRAAQHWVLQTTSPDDPSPTYLLTESDYETGWASHVLVRYTNETEKNIRLPDGIRSIRDGDETAAFYERGLESVSLPDSLVNIYSHAFYGNQLTEITIPGNVAFIGTMAFRGNPITRITVTGSEPLVIQDRVFGTGYAESKEITDAFRQAYADGGAGTYEWNGETWALSD